MFKDERKKWMKKIRIILENNTWTFFAEKKLHFSISHERKMFFQSSLNTYTRGAKKIVTIRERNNTHSLNGMKVKVKLLQMRSYITYKRQKKIFLSSRRRTKLCETKPIAESIFLYL